MYYQCYNLTGGGSGFFVDPSYCSSMTSSFYYCNHLTQCPGEIPRNPNGSVAKTMSSTFQYCTNIITGIVYINTTSLSSTFDHCYKLTGCSIPNTVTSMSSTFSYCNGMVNMPNIPNSVTTLYSCFSNCHNLKNTTAIPNSVTNIAYTFSYCYNLINAPAIPNSVTSMINTFTNCYNLTTVSNIPNTITNAIYAFYGCNKLANITLNAPNLTNLYNTFFNCTNLTTVNLNTGVANMRYAFYNCSNLTTINGEINTTNLYYTFYYCNKLAGNLVFPSNSMTISLGFSSNATSGYKQAVAYTNTTTWNSLNSYALPTTNSYNLALVDRNAYDRAKTNFLTDYTYTNNGAAIILTRYTGTATSVYVPDKFNNLPVYVTNNTFKNNDTITSVFIHPKAKMNDAVGNMFYDCLNLKEVRSIPDSITNMS